MLCYVLYCVFSLLIIILCVAFFFFFSSRRRHTRLQGDWSSDVCSSDLNTGAILNRINFGMAAAAGRLPGVSLAALPALDTIRSAPRDKQVDAVVAAILNGMVSPDTRAVLVSGEHPMLAGGARGASGRAEV